MSSCRVLVVDDSPEFLSSVLNYLSADPSVMVVGTARSGEEAIEMVGALLPDLVLMDIAMPGMNGIRATELIGKIKDPPPVIMLTLYDTDEYRSRAMMAGARGFIRKAEFGAEIGPAIASLFPDVAGPPAGR